MSSGPFKDEAAARLWLLDQWTSHFAAAIAAMTGQTAAIGGTDPELSESARWYRQELSLPGASLLFGAAEQDWLTLGTTALKGAGLTEVSQEDAHGACVELLAQATSSLAHAIARELGQEVTARAAQRASLAGPPSGAGGFSFDLGANGMIPVIIVLSPELTAALMPAPPTPETSSVPPRVVPPSRTLDLLMEVELPVSISFGRANLPLREVLKLNSGSIVELNRTISELVEVIVNNCVIARGEVVVVDGNYGIRIQHVISREERLRSLN